MFRNFPNFPIRSFCAGLGCGVRKFGSACKSTIFGALSEFTHPTGIIRPKPENAGAGSPAPPAGNEIIIALMCTDRGCIGYTLDRKGNPRRIKRSRPKK